MVSLVCLSQRGGSYWPTEQWFKSCVSCVCVLYHYLYPRVSIITSNVCSVQLSSPQEDEIVRLLHHICCLSYTVSTQVIEQGSNRYHSFINKTMRSRQRNTYRRMLDRYATFWCCIYEAYDSLLIFCKCTAPKLSSTIYLCFSKFREGRIHC